jgi:diguanylate cyclase (GGDEF)-like protein/PAS domain S-box-containing protein
MTGAEERAKKGDPDSFRLPEGLGAEDGLQAILAESPIGVSVSRRSDGIVIFANPTFTALLGLTSEQFIGTRARDHYVDEAQRNAVVDLLRRHGRVDHAEVRFRRADGTPFWSLLTIRSTRFAGQEVNLAWIYDITERKASEDKLLLAAKVVETANEGILVTNAEARIEAVNGAFTRITGYGPEDAIGRDPRFLKSGRHEPSFFRDMWQTIRLNGRWQGEVWNRRADGGVYAAWLSIAAVRDGSGQVSHYLGIFSDITARKEDDERVWRQANFDALTGLPNRALFLDRLAMATRNARREGTSFALAFIDLDGFKAVNDAYGHAAGDQVLIEAGNRLAAGVRCSDTVARLSGDEFTIILQHVATRDDVATVAAKLVDVLADPFPVEGHRVRVCASVGLALYPEDASDVAMLMKAADQAMYAVKRRGKNGYCFHGGLPVRLPQLALAPPVRLRQM